MDLDLLFVLGVALGVLMIPAVVSAILDGRTPRTPAILLIVSGLMIGYPIMQKPNAYSFAEIPELVTKVLGRYVY